MVTLLQNECEIHIEKISHFRVVYSEKLIQTTKLRKFTCFCNVASGNLFDFATVTTICRIVFAASFFVFLKKVHLVRC